MTQPTGRLLLYERANCHLCEEARRLLDELIGRDAYDRIDIDADDDLVMRYGFRIPVVALDGIDRLDAPISAPDLRALLAEAASQRVAIATGRPGSPSCLPDG